jgi:uncharacterized membrane protein
MSQLSLLCLFIKIFQILISTMNLTFHPILNNITCKIVSYSLSTCTRMCLWLTAFIAIERAYVTIYPSNQWLKQPKIARRILLLIIIVTLASHIHELMYYHSAQDPKYIEHGKFSYDLYDMNQRYPPRLTISRCRDGIQKNVLISEPVTG